MHACHYVRGILFLVLFVCAFFFFFKRKGIWGHRIKTKSEKRERTRNSTTKEAEDSSRGTRSIVSPSHRMWSQKPPRWSAGHSVSLLLCSAWLNIYLIFSHPISAPSGVIYIPPVGVKSTWGEASYESLLHANRFESKGFREL